MKKTVIIVVGLLLCVVGATVIGQKKNLSPKEERREVREKRRADRTPRPCSASRPAPCVRS